MKPSSPRSSEPEIIRFQGKEAVRFITASGVTAVVATSIGPESLHALKVKLERKLKRRGLLPASGR